MKQNYIANEPPVNTYNPRNWVMLKVHNTESNVTCYKILAGWGANSWRMNSGCVRVEETETEFLFHGYSGSIYHCGKHCYGLSVMSHSILSRLESQQTERLTVEMLPEETNWKELKYE